MLQQIENTLKPKSRGFHLVTDEIVRHFPKLPRTGIINIFCKYTSCGLSIPCQVPIFNSPLVIGMVMLTPVNVDFA